MLCVVVAISGASLYIWQLHYTFKTEEKLLDFNLYYLRLSMQKKIIIPNVVGTQKTILATQVFKSLNGFPYFQTAAADPTVHLICLHVFPRGFSSLLSLSVIFSHWAGISWTSVLGKHTSSTSTAPAPPRMRKDVGMEF